MDWNLSKTGTKYVSVVDLGKESNMVKDRDDFWVIFLFLSFLLSFFFNINIGYKKEIKNVTKSIPTRSKPNNETSAKKTMA